MEESINLLIKFSTGQPHKGKCHKVTSRLLWTRVSQIFCCGSKETKNYWRKRKMFQGNFMAIVFYSILSCIYLSRIILCNADLIKRA